MGQPYPNPSNMTGLTDVIEYSNTVTGGYMTILFSFACFIVLLMILKGRMVRTSDAVSISGLLTLILSSFLWALGLLAGNILVIFLLITVAATMWSIFDKS